METPRSMDVENALGKLEGAIDKACKFLSRNLPQHSDTWLGSSPSDFKLSSNAYMILTQAYQAGGRPKDAAEVVEFFEKSYSSACDKKVNATDPASVLSGQMRAYHPSFGAISMMQMGRPDLSSKLMRQVLPYQGQGALGGFFGGHQEASTGNGVFCFDSSCAATIACLWTGQVDAARRGGNYLLRLAAVSTDERWYWSINESGTPVSSLEHPSWNNNQFNPLQPGQRRFPMHDERWCFMTKGADHQAHWKTGFYLACCAYLYRQFDDERFLVAAEKCAAFACACRESGCDWRMWSHKLAWGAAELYNVTKNIRWLRMAYEVGMMLVARQCSEGYWKYEEWFPDEASRPIQVMYSIAAQAATWMGKVRDALLSYSRELNKDIGSAAASETNAGSPKYSRNMLLAAHTGLSRQPSQMSSRTTSGELPVKNTFLHFDEGRGPAAGTLARSTTAPADGPPDIPQPQLNYTRTESLWSDGPLDIPQPQLNYTRTESVWSRGAEDPTDAPESGYYVNRQNSAQALDRTVTEESYLFPQYRPGPRNVASSESADLGIRTYTDSQWGEESPSPCSTYVKPTMQDISVDTEGIVIKNTFIDFSPVSTPVTSGLQKSTTSPPQYFGLEKQISRKDSQCYTLYEDDEENAAAKKKAGFYETKSKKSKSTPVVEDDEKEDAPEYDPLDNLPAVSAGALRVADDKYTVAWAPRSEQLSRQSAEHQVISPSFTFEVDGKQVNFKLMIRPSTSQNRRGVMRAAFKNTQYRQLQLKCLDDPESMAGTRVDVTFQVISAHGVDQRAASFDFRSAICEPNAGENNWEMRPPKAKSGEKPLVIAVRLTAAARPVRF
eukprot:gnl/MRDRNA2_/MRDRNA2_34646_c0_seq1.p1 gnl/MRDRNA2_/MRDRNA2_34646_c0~~gnl/MRDRNA2_/MRDRNA2_34646_c0_seq1.p1  ORF type:complete len:866 (+),score=148.25 gnl/MRDRNA2_/MRDRNA2_34646_c0_seq1:85-2598(+)